MPGPIELPVTLSVQRLAIGELRITPGMPAEATEPPDDIVLTDIVYYLIFTAYILFTIRVDAPVYYMGEVHPDLVKVELVRIGGILLDGPPGPRQPTDHETGRAGSGEEHDRATAGEVGHVVEQALRPALFEAVGDRRHP